MTVICNVCCEEMEFARCEWAKYMMSDSEELVSIYRCDKCASERTIRDDPPECDELDDL